MIYYEEIPITQKKIKSIQCDKCQTIYSVDDDILEIQEFHRIKFIGGYGSIFGDGDHIECDLCQRCFKEMIKDCHRIVDREFKVA